MGSPRAAREGERESNGSGPKPPPKQRQNMVKITSRGLGVGGGVGRTALAAAADAAGFLVGQLALRGVVQRADRLVAEAARAHPRRRLGILQRRIQDSIIRTARIQEF